MKSLRICFILTLCLICKSSLAGITAGGNVIVTPSLVGINYSVTPGIARVTLDLNVKSDSSGAGVKYYNYDLKLGNAPGSSVSITPGPLYVAFNWPVVFGANNSGDTYNFTGTDFVSHSLNATDQLVATVVYDITQSSTAATYNVTLPVLQSNDGTAINTVSAGGLPLVLNINAYSGGGGASVPEPGSVLAISAVLGGLGIRALRRRRQDQAA